MRHPVDCSKRRPQARFDRAGHPFALAVKLVAMVGLLLPGAQAEEPSTVDVKTAGADTEALGSADFPGTVVPLIEREGGPWERFAQNPSANPLRTPNLDPSQAGNIDRGAGRRFEGPDDGPASSMTTDSTSPRASRSRPDLAHTIARVTRHQRSDGAIAAILSRSASFRGAGQGNASVP